MNQLATVRSIEEKLAFKRNFQVHRFIVGNLVSFFGDQIYLIALPLMVLAVTGSPLSMGIVAALERLPILTQPVAGVLADRFNRKNLLLLCDFFRFFIIGILGVWFLIGTLPIGAIYIGAFIVGILGQLYNTSQFASVPKLVRKSDLQLVNSLNTGMLNTAVFLAPGLGGLIVSLYNPGVGLIINSVSFFIGFLTVCSLSMEGDNTKVEGSSFLIEIKEGFAFVLKQKLILYTNLAMLFSIFGTTLFLTMMVVHLKAELSLSPVQIGWILSAGGLGAIIGALFSNIIRQRISYQAVLFSFGILGGISIVLFGFFESVFMLAILNAVGTAGAAVMSPCIVTLRQTLTPDRLLGRVQATSRFMTWLLMPAAALLAGIIGEYMSTGTTIWMGGLIAATASFLYLHPSLKEA